MEERKNIMVRDGRVSLYGRDTGGKNEIGNLTYPGIEASWHRPREPRHRISRVDSWVKGGRNETVAFLSLRR